jgi:SAM-dependent methyltransferase
VSFRTSSTSADQLAQPRQGDDIWTRTANGKGYHLKTISDFERDFISLVAAGANAQIVRGTYVPAARAGRCLCVADLGCGLGFTTEACLLGTPSSVQVSAVDLSGEHLEELWWRVQGAHPELLARLRTASGSATDPARFEAGSLAGVMACRWLHFLEGPALREFFHTAACWLRPPSAPGADDGGYLVATVETPYLKTMWDNGFAAVFERRLRRSPGLRPEWVRHTTTSRTGAVPPPPVLPSTGRGDGAQGKGSARDGEPAAPPQADRAVEWPGYVDIPPEYPDAGALPPRMHFLEPAVLQREAEAAGLRVLRCDFIPRPYYPKHLVWDGRESAGLLAQRLR